MAAMGLRSPSNGEKIVREGGITTVLEAMRRHPTAQALQRQVSSCPNLPRHRSELVLLLGGFVDEVVALPCPTGILAAGGPLLKRCALGGQLG